MCTLCDVSHSSLAKHLELNKNGLVELNAGVFNGLDSLQALYQTYVTKVFLISHVDWKGDIWHGRSSGLHTWRGRGIWDGAQGVIGNSVECIGAMGHAS